MRVLIAGCGYVGTALGQELCRAGHEVWGLRRRAEALPEPIVPIQADLGDKASLNSLPDALSHVVYAASADGSSPEAYQRAYVEGLSNLLATLAAKASSPRVLFTSSTAVYAQSAGERVDEMSITAPTHFSGKLLLEAEAAVIGSGLPHTVLRLGGIYGPGRTSLLDKVREGSASLPPSGTFTNRIHRDDCAGAIAHLLALPHPEPVYVGADHDPADRRTVLTWLADALGVSLQESPDVTPEPGGRGSSNKRVDSTRLRQSGYTFRFPTFREGYGRMIAEGRGGVTDAVNPRLSVLRR